MRMACSNASNLKHSHLCSAAYPRERSQPGCVFTQDCIKIISLCLLLQQTKPKKTPGLHLVCCIASQSLIYTCALMSLKRKKNASCPKQRTLCIYSLSTNYPILIVQTSLGHCRSGLKSTKRWSLISRVFGV